MIVPSGSIRNATIIPGSFVSITTPCSASRLSRWKGSAEIDSSARSSERRIWSLARLAFRSLYAGAQSRLMSTSVVLSHGVADLDIEPDRPDVRLELLRTHPGEVIGSRPPPAKSRLPPEIGREAPVPSRNREPDRAQLGQFSGLLLRRSRAASVIRWLLPSALAATATQTSRAIRHAVSESLPPATLTPCATRSSRLATRARPSNGWSKRWRPRTCPSSSTHARRRCRAGPSSGEERSRRPCWKQVSDTCPCQPSAPQRRSERKSATGMCLRTATASA